MKGFFIFCPVKTDFKKYCLLPKYARKIILP